MTFPNRYIAAVLVAILAACGSARAQDSTGQHPAGGQQTQARQAQSQEPPKLEIPEITIVGKKAITLPFARKGEIYDVDVYNAPAPDSSLLVESNSMILMKGSLPRYEQEQHPWRWSAEGLLGTFSTFGGGVFADYRSERWRFAGDFHGESTQGHVDNSNSTLVAGGIEAATDLLAGSNQVPFLASSFGASFRNESYGLFGITSTQVRRKTGLYNFDARISSIHRQSGALDAGIEAPFMNLTDRAVEIDSSVSAFSPRLYASYEAPVRDVTVGGGLSYTTSVLDYQHESQSPSLVDLNMKARWKTPGGVEIEAGGMFAGGSSSTGEDRSLVMPVGSFRWQFDTLTGFRVFFDPVMELHTYQHLLSLNPYLDREMVIDPQRSPVKLGATLDVHGGAFSFDLTGSYATFTNHELMIADTGHIHLEYAGAKEARLEFNFHYIPASALRITGTASAVSAHETGSSVQLPMTPPFVVRGRAETDGPIGTTVWSSVEYQSSRNVDRLGTQSLKDVFLLNAGGSLHTIPRIVLQAEVRNLFNLSYDWWAGYPAPGINLNVSAKFNIQ